MSSLLKDAGLQPEDTCLCRSVSQHTESAKDRHSAVSSIMWDSATSPQPCNKDGADNATGDLSSDCVHVCSLTAPYRARQIPLGTIFHEIHPATVPAFASLQVHEEGTRTAQLAFLQSASRLLLTHRSVSLRGLAGPLESLVVHCVTPLVSDGRLGQPEPLTVNAGASSTGFGPKVKQAWSASNTGCNLSSSAYCRTLSGAL